jgi:hypothetical protein
MSPDGPAPRASVTSAPHLRVARPVRDPERAAQRYVRGLAWAELGRFEDHDGFDGVMVGPPMGPYHLELTRCRTHPVSPAPTSEDLLVLYLPDVTEWRTRCDAMAAAGFRAVLDANPYWRRHARTFEDDDGHRVVIANAGWPSGPPAGP